MNQLSPVASILKGETIGAIQPQQNPRWVGDELLLLVVHTQDKDSLYTHHLFV